MLRDSGKNGYSYFEFDAPEMLDKLLEKWVIELPELRRSEEIGRINDIKYCTYHRIISHPIEKYKAFKRQVLKSAKKGKITLDEEDIKESDWSYIKIILENVLEEGQPKMSIELTNFHLSQRLLSQT